MARFGPSARAGPSDRRRWLALAFIALAQLMIALDAAVLNIALPSAPRALGFADRQQAIRRLHAHRREAAPSVLAFAWFVRHEARSTAPLRPPPVVRERPRGGVSRFAPLTIAGIVRCRHWVVATLVMPRLVPWLLAGAADGVRLPGGAARMILLCLPHGHHRRHRRGRAGARLCRGLQRRFAAAAGRCPRRGRVDRASG
jgi:hypothetical protein